MALTYNEFLEQTGFTSKTVFRKILFGNKNHYNLYNDYYAKPYKNKTDGLYFTTEDGLLCFAQCGINAVTIKLREDAIFYIDPERKLCYKTNKFIVTRIHQPTYFCMFSVSKNGLTLQYVKKQTEEICKSAVKQNGLALQYVKNQTKEICEIAIRQNANAVQYVKSRNLFLHYMLQINTKHIITQYKYCAVIGLSIYLHQKLKTLCLSIK